MRRTPAPDTAASAGSSTPQRRGRLRPRTGPGGRRGRRWLAAGGGAGLAAVLLAACSSGPGTPKAATAGSAATIRTTTTTTSPPPACPLTGAPVPGGGAVPQRPALAVKIDNYPTARPQTGLDKADVVFEEPVEGGITRLVAVYQCQDASLLGPVRSARNIDIGILGQLGRPLLVHVGGIQPVIADIDASPVVNFDLGAHTSIITHVPGRHAPYDTYTSTADVWGFYKTRTTTPQPLFAYSAATPAGTPVSAVSIPFSSYSEVHWHYDPPSRTFQRYYGATPDHLSTGTQVSAANVVVQVVHVTYGPWLENSTGGLEVQANLDDNASGPAMVFRDGVEVTGRWSRTSLGQATQFTSASGTAIALQPGATWVELVPDTIPVAATPAG
ncbi:MAG: DUF3048 domain-containing protein [Acidimicrobiales bacterium]